MRIDMAPMEGITNYIYRNAFAMYFGGVDRYYTPFISPNQNCSFMTKELNEISPAHNEGKTVIPQILTNNPEHFLWAAGELKSRGYTEVNLNLGCPSGTVVAKKKGSGFLTEPDRMDEFFDTVFSRLDGMRLSVKTRLGRYAPEEFAEVLEIYNRYPICELIIHPRFQKEFYKGSAHREWFDYAASHSPLPLSYNGDCFDAEDIRGLAEKYPQLHTVMLGRGLIGNAALAEEAKGIGTRDKKRFIAFHDELYARYSETLYGDKAVLSRMKETWVYQLQMFTNYEEYVKPLRKTQHRSDYESVVNRLFTREELITGPYTYIQ